MNAWTTGSTSRRLLMKLEIKTSLEIWGISEENKDTLTFFEQVKWQPVDENIEWLEKQYDELNKFTSDKNTGRVLDIMYNIFERIKVLKGERE